MAFPSKPLTQLLGSNVATEHETDLHCLQAQSHALAYSASPSTYILTGSADRSVRLYNPSRPADAAPSGAPNQLHPPRATQLIQTYAAHGYEVLDVSVAHDNATFASVGGDRSVFLWDVASAQTIRRFGGNHGHTSRINAVTFAGVADSCLVSGSFDSSVRLWDVKAHSMKPIMVLEDAKDSVSSVLAGGGGNAQYEIVSGSVDGRVRYYDIRMGKLDVDVIGVSVTSLQRTRDGKGVLVGALDSSLRLMDRENGGLLRAYKSAGPANGAFKNDEFRLRTAFGAHERWVLCGNEDTGNQKEGDGEVVVWDTLAGKVAHTITVQGSTAERKKKIGTDGKEKERRNVISCISWKESGRGDQWCCAGTDGIVTVFGPVS